MGPKCDGITPREDRAEASRQRPSGPDDLSREDREDPIEGLPRAAEGDALDGALAADGAEEERLRPE